MTNQIKLDLAAKNVSQKIQLLRDIVTQMTGNANFTTPAPTLASVTAAADALQAALSAQQTAEQAAKTATTNLGLAESTADAKINSLSNYVWETSGGVEAKIQTAGLNLRAPKTPTTSLPAPQNLALTAGDNEGELDAGCDPVAKTKTYEWQTSDDPPTNTSWAYAKTTTKAATTLTGLASGTKKWVRVRALGPKEITSPWSDPALKRVP